MNQHSVSSTIVAGWVVAALLSLPTGADAAPKPAPKPSSGNTCESAFKQTRPASKILDKVLQSHARWLEDRDSPDGRRANLCRTDLRQLRLVGANLERINLEGAILKGSNLRTASLVQAHLKGADLSQAVLDDANLEGADLRKALLVKAHLNRIAADEAAFYRSNLQGALFRVALLERARDLDWVMVEVPAVTPFAFGMFASKIRESMMMETPEEAIERLYETFQERARAGGMVR